MIYYLCKFLIVIAAVLFILDTLTYYQVGWGIKCLVESGHVKDTTKKFPENEDGNEIADDYIALPEFTFSFVNVAVKISSGCLETQMLAPHNSYCEIAHPPPRL